MIPFTPIGSSGSNRCSLSEGISKIEDKGMQRVIVAMIGRVRYLFEVILIIEGFFDFLAEDFVRGNGKSLALAAVDLRELFR